MSATQQTASGRVRRRRRRRRDEQQLHEVLSPDSHLAVTVNGRLLFRYLGEPLVATWGSAA